MPLPEQAVDQNGAPVNLYGAASRLTSYRERYTFTDETGGYTLDGIPAGDYIAVAVRHGLETDQKPVTITSSGVTTVDFQLQARRPRAGVIEGRVVNAETGEPVGNAGVSLLHGPVPMPIAFPEPIGGGGFAPPGTVGGGAPGNTGAVGGGSGGAYIVPDEFDFYVTTAADGTFRMRAPAGETVIHIYAEGYLPAEQTVVVPLRSAVAVEVKLTKRIVREVTLSGRVVTGAASTVPAPVAGATVYASPISEGYHIMNAPGSDSAVMTGSSRMHPYVVYSAVTDADGRYNLKLQSGAYYLYAAKDNLYSEPIRQEINNDLAQDFRLVEYANYPSPGR
jgi:hypothetical protein